MARLGDLCDIRNGYAFKSDKYVNDGVRIIRIANVQKGYIEDTSPVYYSVDDINAQKYALHEGDLLISLTGNVGRVGILTEQFLPAALNQRVANIVVKDNRLLDKSFLFHLLNSDTFENKCIFSANGVAQKNLSTDWLKEVEIPLPPIDEQRKIAAVLDKNSDLTAKRRSQLDKLDELVKSRFVEMFGNFLGNQGEKTTLSDVCKIITDGTHQPPEFVPSGIPFLFVSNIVTNEITYDAEKFISEDTYNELIKRTPIELGDILLSTVGSYGHPAIVKSDKRFCFQRHIAYLKPKAELVDSVYLHSAILSDDVQRQIGENVKGIAQKTLNLSEIRKIKVQLPSMESQKRFAEMVTHIDKIKLQVRASLDKLEMLKKARMQEYFR